MRVRVATEGVRFVVVQDPSARTDRDGRQRVDTRTGALLWQVSLVPIGDEVMREAITVTVDAEPSVAPGEFVEVHGLVASTWEVEGRSGIAFRASRVEPTKSVRPVPTGTNAAATSAA
jgi:hypothetical protein